MGLESFTQILHTRCITWRPDHIEKLIGKVVTISLETQKVIDSLPPLMINLKLSQCQMTNSRFRPLLH
jgi:hypothetical protein